MSHAYSGDIYNAIWLNEEICSEGYLNALFAAECVVPEKIFEIIKSAAPEWTISSSQS